MHKYQNGSLKQTRKLFTLPDPFEFYKRECIESCGLEPTMDPFLNACPKCSERYTPCNHCCFGGASSLKLCWHGCPRKLTLITPKQAHQNCGVKILLNKTDVSFIDCTCFDKITTPGAGLFGCGLYESVTYLICQSLFHKS